MILLDLIKLKLSMPSTARFMSDFGVVVGAAGSLAFFLSIPLPLPPPVVLSVGVAIWRLSEWRLRVLRRAGR